MQASHRRHPQRNNFSPRAVDCLTRAKTTFSRRLYKSGIPDLGMSANFVTAAQDTDSTGSRGQKYPFSWLNRNAKGLVAVMYQAWAEVWAVVVMYGAWA